MVLSTNSKLAIKLAREFWLPAGVASIALLILTCYGGWWYQSHWRREFTDVVTMLCKISEDDREGDVGIGGGGGKGDGEYVIGGGAGGEAHGNRRSRVDDIFEIYHNAQRLGGNVVIIRKTPDGNEVVIREDEVREGDHGPPHVLERPGIPEVEERLGDHGSPYVLGRPGSPELGGGLERRSSDGLLVGDEEHLGIHPSPYGPRPGNPNGEGGVLRGDDMEMMQRGARGERVRRKPLPS